MLIKIGNREVETTLEKVLQDLIDSDHKKQEQIECLQIRVKTLEKQTDGQKEETAVLANHGIKAS